MFQYKNGSKTLFHKQISPHLVVLNNRLIILTDHWFCESEIWQGGYEVDFSLHQCVLKWMRVTQLVGLEQQGLCIHFHGASSLTPNTWVVMAEGGTQVVFLSKAPVGCLWHGSLSAVSFPTWPPVICKSKCYSEQSENYLTFYDVGLEFIQMDFMGWSRESPPGFKEMGHTLLPSMPD